MFETLSWTAVLFALLHAAMVIGITLRVIARRRPTGEALAWIAIVATFPYGGAAMYILVGEAWLSGRRARRTAEIALRYRPWVDELDERFGHPGPFQHAGADAIARLGRHAGYSMPIAGNDTELIGDDETLFDPLLRDIRGAERSCDLLYYIWQSAGRVHEVEDALIEAQGRGVRCRVMVDAMGGGSLLDGARGRALRDAGVELRASLPVSPLRGKFGRLDIRNHRKLAVIDGRTAYAGSHNMVDARVFKQKEGVGQWIDLTLRVRGPITRKLNALFELDWAMEDAHVFEPPAWAPVERTEGDVVLQMVPSGPGQQPETLRRMFAAALYGARERLTLTTPYLVPDATFLAGLLAAPARGVETTVIVPERIDSPLVRQASRSYYDRLIDAGVRLYAYEGGLLHAKTVTVDDDLAIIGTVNLDKRSFWLNYELSLIVQGGHTVRDLERVQREYLSRSHPVCESAWMRRGRLRRYVENAFGLMSPLL